MTATTDRPAAEIWDVTLEAYHQDRTCISHSAKECFRRSQKLYHAVYVAGTMDPPEPTEAMVLGSLLHLCVLEPERWIKEICIAPHCDRRTKDGKAQWAAFLEFANGKQVVDAQQHILVHDMTTAILSNPVSRALLSRDGKVEQAIKWLCQDTGLSLKSRRDFVASDLIVDLKTARDASPEAFAGAAARLGYARQAAHYLDGQETLTGTEAAFVFVVVENKPPHTVACYELDEEAIHNARIQNLDTLRRMAVCRDTGQWEALFERQITRLSLPRWSNYTDYEMEMQT